MVANVVEMQAKMLARENVKNDPSIERVYWFPDVSEVRLVELTRHVPVSADGSVEPFYFRPNPARDLPVPTGIALIRPEEFGSLKLPEKWGGWETARLLEEAGE